MMVYIEEENFKLKSFFFINHFCLTCNILWVDKSKKQTTRLKFFLFLFSLSLRNIFSPFSISPPSISFLFKFLHTLFLLPASSFISWTFLSSCYYFLNFFSLFLPPIFLFFGGFFLLFFSQYLFFSFPPFLIFHSFSLLLLLFIASYLLSLSILSFFHLDLSLSPSFFSHIIFFSTFSIFLIPLFCAFSFF